MKIHLKSLNKDKWSINLKVSMKKLEKICQNWENLLKFIKVDLKIMMSIKVNKKYLSKTKALQILFQDFLHIKIL